jgi:hypothetical protein
MGFSLGRLCPAWLEDQLFPARAFPLVSVRHKTDLLQEMPRSSVFGPAFCVDDTVGKSTGNGLCDASDGFRR